MPRRRTRKARGTGGAVLVTALLLALAPAGAHALAPDAPDPAAFQANGGVFAIARSGGLTYIGGSFTELSARTGPGVRFNAANGLRVAPVAEVEDGQVLASVPDGAGGYYIGGSFTKVGGETRNRIAHILPSGELDPAFNPNANGNVFALALDGGAVYAGGLFNGANSIGGAERNYIAKLSASSGNAFSAWNPDANDNVYALAVDGGAVYAGGEFAGADSIGGEDRNFIAKLSAASGNAFSAWNPNANAIVAALAVADGAVYAGGDFNGADSIGGEDRNYIAKLSAASGNAFSAWNPNATNSVLALALADGAVYAGGLFNGADSIGGEDRNRIAKLSASSGNAFSAWNPDANNEVRALAVADGVVYAGGLFNGPDSIGGAERNRIAKLSATSGNAFSAFNPNANGTVNALAVSGGTVYAGGSFDTVNPRKRNRIAALDATGAPTAFNPDANDAVVALAVEDGAVYAGGAFDGPDSIGGADRNFIAKLSAASGNAFSAWNPNASNFVSALAVEAGAVYAGGAFNGADSIGGQDRNYIAKLSAASGNAFSAWNPEATNEVLALAVDGNAVYAGGAFNGADSIGGEDRNRIAKLSAASGNAFSAWNPDANGTVSALALGDGAVYAGGSFNGADSIGGEDRNRIAKLSASSGNAFSAWDPNANNPVDELAVDGSVVYAGGFFNGPDSIGGEDRNRIAKLSASSGDAFAAWNPNADARVRALAADGGAVYIGGAFLMLDGRPRQGYAQFGTAP